jgi:hypothetical protein
MKIKEKKITLLIYFILFSLFFLSFLSIKLWDYDFWWHIATGRYIVENHEIPSQDRFSYITEYNRELFKSTSLREKFLMRQYWLAQVIFYYIYTIFGPWGIVTMRSLLLTLTLWLVYKGLRKFGVPNLLSFSLLIPVFYVLHKYTGERPVLFSFVLAVLVFLVIESFLKSKGKTIYFLPLVMLVWSNLHGGFALGVVFIGVYLTVEILKVILKKSELSKNKFYLFISLMALSLISSFLNPNGLITILMFQSKYQVFTASVQEYQPLLNFYVKKVFSIDYSLFFIIVLTVITLILRFMRMQLSHLILAIGLLIMSFLHQRYFVFSATVGIIIVGKEIGGLYRTWLSRYESSKWKNFRTVLVSAMALFILFSAVKTTLALADNIKKNFSGDHVINTGRYAIEFIEENRIPGRMFNTDAIGGYAIWRLYPWKQVFTDTRAIDIASLVEYKAILAAKTLEKGKELLWERLLEMYNINFVVIEPLDYYGGLVPLIKAINENEHWVLIYTDSNCLIFIRNSEENKDLIKRFHLNKELGYWSIIAKASFMALGEKTENPFFFSTIGECFMKLRNYNEAEKAFRHVLRIEPGNAVAAKTLAEIRDMKTKRGDKQG